MYFLLCNYDNNLIINPHILTDISSTYILTRKNYICIKIQIAEKSSIKHDFEYYGKNIIDI